nr:unnamed protein product [Digitaria exilis]
MAEGQKMPSLEDVPALAVTKATEEGGKPAWLKALVRTRFWEPCDEHRGVTRGQRSLFCVHCYEAMCPHCRHHEPGHHLLKIRRYGYRSVVDANDMKALGVDVSNLQLIS